MSGEVAELLPILALLETTCLARLKQAQQALQDTQSEITDLENDWKSPSERPEETLDFLTSGSESKYQTWRAHRLTHLKHIRDQQLAVVAQRRADANTALGRHLVGKEIARTQLKTARQVTSRQQA